MPPKPKKSSSVYAVVGSDESEVKRRARALAAQLAPPDAGEFGLDLIDGATENAEQAVRCIRGAGQALETLPFFGGKLVWLKDASFLGDNVAARAASVQAALEDLKAILTEALPPGVNFLLSAPEIDKRRGFYRALGKIAKVEILDKIDVSRSGWEEDAKAVAEQFANELELSFAPDALEEFVLLAGADSRLLRGELEKIDLYLGAERTISSETVAKLVTRSVSGVIWELSNCISKRNLPRSLRLLEQLLAQGETAIGILFGAVIPTVRNLLAVKELAQSYRLPRVSAPYQFNTVISGLPEEALRYLPRKKDGTLNTFGLGFAACEVHRFTLAELVAGLRECLRANYRFVTSQLDPRLVLGELLVKLLAPEAVRRKSALGLGAENRS